MRELVAVLAQTLACVSKSSCCLKASVLLVAMSAAEIQKQVAEVQKQIDGNGPILNRLEIVCNLLKSDWILMTSGSSRPQDFQQLPTPCLLECSCGFASLNIDSCRQHVVCMQSACRLHVGCMQAACRLQVCYVHNQHAILNAQTY